jgi:hypothetical protein
MISNDDIIMGMFFFLDDIKVEHSRAVYNVQAVLSKSGGVATSLLAFCGLFASIYNYYMYAQHFIHLLYFVRKDNLNEDIVRKLTF